MSSTTPIAAAAASTQIVTLPELPELYDPNFLDVLLPPTTDMDVSHDRTATSTPSHPMMDALKSTAHQTFTANGAPALSSTLSSLLDAFNNISYSSDDTLSRYLEDAWKEDANLTLRIIWNLRSIHDGKGEKESFYKAFGWLYDNHPRTAIANLHLLVKPVCSSPKGRYPRAHGYWKDLLNILALAAMDQLHVTEPTFLHTPRMPWTYPHSHPARSAPIGGRIIPGQGSLPRAAVATGKTRRGLQNEGHHKRLTRKLAEPKFRALYVGVARLFADQLAKDMRVLDEIAALEPGADRIPLLKQISLAGKWAPTPSGAHDRVTNISTAIILLLQRAQVPAIYPSAVSGPLDPHDKCIVLRSFFQRWVLTELRRTSACIEPLMSANRWKEIRYNRVPSLCMKTNTEHFFRHDPEGFQQYLIKVESGKRTISGATLLPHELVKQALKTQDAAEYTGEGGKFPELMAFRRELAETQMRVVEAQWKTMIERLRESGSMDNSLAICDVSGSMGMLSEPSYTKYTKHSVDPILPAVSLSLVLAQLARPPFNGGFITFSQNPKFIQLDPTKSLCATVNEMSQAEWAMNTDLNAVFLKLLLPLAVKNGVKQEDMIKRLFIFSDMQFDSARSQGRGTADWETNYDVIEKTYKAAGYAMPEIVYWDLAGYGTVEVAADRKGVAMMNGFSPAMMKVFMGEEAEADEWEKVSEDGESVTVLEKVQEEFNPINVMKKALMRASFDELVVVD